MDKNLIARVRRAETSFSKMLEDKKTVDILTQGRIQGYLRQGFAALEQVDILQAAAREAADAEQAA